MIQMVEPPRTAVARRISDMENKILEPVRKSFVRLIPMSDIAEKLFREHLSLIEPSFNLEAARPELSAMRTLARLIDSAHDEDRGRRMARRLGFVFAKHGLTPESYVFVERALLWTLRHVPAQDTANEDTIQAWKQLFTKLKHDMSEGAATHSEKLAAHV